MIINFLCLFLEFSFSSLVYMVFLILQINYPLFIPSNFHHVSTGYSQVLVYLLTLFFAILYGCVIFAGEIDNR